MAVLVNEDTRVICQGLTGAHQMASVDGKPFSGARWPRVGPRRRRSTGLLSAAMICCAVTLAACASSVAERPAGVPVDGAWTTSDGFSALAASCLPKKTGVAQVGLGSWRRRLEEAGFALVQTTDSAVGFVERFRKPGGGGDVRLSMTSSSATCSLDLASGQDPAAYVSDQLGSIYSAELRPGRGGGDREARIWVIGAFPQASVGLTKRDNNGGWTLAVAQ